VGTGRNSCLMHRFLGERGRIVGLDIGEEMLTQARQRCRHQTNVTFEKRRIEEPLPYDGTFDVAFMSFVLHGFVQQHRLQIVRNVHSSLRPEGRFFILDYDEVEPAQASWPVRLLFRLECPLATDFVRRDWRQILTDEGFGRFRVHPFYGSSVRLLEAIKQ